MKYLISLLVLTGLLSLPFTVHAEDGGSATPTPSANQKAENMQETRSSSFCMERTNREQELKDNLDKLENSTKEVETEETNSVNTTRMSAVTKLQENRAAWDSEHTKLFTALEAKYPSSPQKEAVTAFEQAVKAAITARRAAVDANAQLYREQLDQALTTKNNAISDATAARRTAIETSMNQAKSLCASGDDLTTIRQNYNQTRATAVQAAQATIKDAVATCVAKRQQILAAWQAANAQALATYKQALTTAQAALQAVIGTAN